MSYAKMAFNPWKWMLSLLSLSLLFLSWKMVVKPYEIKRLKVESTKTANKLIDLFSSRSLENLALIEQLFLNIERDHYEPYSNFIDDLNAHFKRIRELEAFILPSVEMGSPLVLFNPYVIYPEAQVAKEACDQALVKHPDRLKAYHSMTLIPIEGSLCIYDPKLHMFAVLNLKTTLDEHLKKERMKGYFLALLEDQLPELASPNWNLSWIHSSFFSFLGTQWKIHVYPSSAYIEARIKRVFLIFCMIMIGFLSLLTWWLLRRRESSSVLDPDYVAHLKQLALFDGVTNLPNRRYCLDQLNIVLKRAMRRRGHFSVCFMDCDGFKNINDDYGHPVGDQVLRHIADEVLKVIRDNDFFARFSGDEFCLILEDTVSEAALMVILKKILKVISAPIFVGENVISVTMSIGVAVYPNAGNTADILLKHADEAMYAAKRQKNTYSIYQA
ncbi:MAG: GGDEF domain-containing protein [Gammaproteobacteria bacterium]|nr:GGDEF domain-containing protein [Gammaproteobacteria bacterium]